jgi:hypothetical protein
MHPDLLVLQDALDRRLPAEARVEVDRHLAACGPCRRRLHALRWTLVRLADAGSHLPMPDALAGEIRRILVPDPPPADLLPPDPATPDDAAGWRRWFARRRMGERIRQDPPTGTGA